MVVTKPTPNDIFYRNDSTSPPFDIAHNTLEYSQSLCERNVHQNTIEIMLSRKIFYQNIGRKHVWLVGRHFKAYISYTPLQYDQNMVIFKAELSKLYQEVEGSKEAILPKSGTNESVVAATEQKSNRIENVRTFAVLPTGELIVFFADQYCYLNYYDLEVGYYSTMVCVLLCDSFVNRKPLFH